jgi:hypothetical protein
MKTRQNRWNGGAVGREDYLEMNNIISASQNYSRNVGTYLQGLTLTPYVRPTEWVSLPSITAGEQKFAGVFAVFNNDSNFVAFTVAGNYTVDWGDGTTGSFSSGSAAYKRYDTSTYAGLTSTVYNDYKTLVITITPTGAANLTSINLTTKHNQSNLSTYQNQWLNIRIAGSNLSTIQIGTSANPGVWPIMLEQYEFIGNNNITSFSGQFENARKLKNLILPENYTEKGTNLTGMFSSCVSIQKIPDLNTNSATNLSSLFQNCFNLLNSPKLSNTSKVTSMGNLYSNCRSLTEIPFLDTSNVTDASGMFTFCTLIKTIPWMDFSKVTNLSSTFSSCYNLRKIPFLNVSNVTSMNRTFNFCQSLEEYPPLNTGKVTDFTFCFGNCQRLQKLIVDTKSTTSLGLMFAYGTSIEEITFTDTSNVTNFFYTFNSCGVLRKINNLNLSKATNYEQMFTGCVSLLTLPELPINFNATNFGGLFYGTSLSTIGNTFFNLPNATSVAQFFQFNGNLIEAPEIDAPNALNANSMFRACINLVRIKGLTLARGASMATFNTSGFNNMFFDCGSLIQVPPLDVSGLTGSGYASVFSGMFTNARSLSSLKGFTGAAYNLDITGCKLSGTALNELYESLAVVGASGSGTRTVTVTNNWGAASDNPSIAIAKGWTVTG